MPGRMLCINEGFGYRPILSVQHWVNVPQLNDRPASTWIYGNQLMFQYDIPFPYVDFFRPSFNTTLLWTQAGIAVDYTIEQVYAIWPKMPLTIVAEEPLQLLHAGKDPLKGYYLHLAGPMRRLFSQPNWWVDGNGDEIQF